MLAAQDRQKNHPGLIIDRNTGRRKRKEERQRETVFLQNCLHQAKKTLPHKSSTQINNNHKLIPKPSFHKALQHSDSVLRQEIHTRYSFSPLEIDWELRIIAGRNYTRGFAVSQVLQSWLATTNSEGPHGINTLPRNQTCTEVHDMVSSDVFHTFLRGTNSPVHL